MAVEKKVFSGKWREYERTYSRFCDRADGKAGVLIGEKSGGCLPIGTELRCGIGVTPVYGSNGGEIAVNGAVDRVYTLAKKRETDSEAKFRFGYTAENGYFEYDESTGAFVKKVSFSGRAGVATVYSDYGTAWTFFAHGNGIDRYSSVGGVERVFTGNALPVARCFKGRVFCAVAPRTLLYHKPYAPLYWNGNTDDGGKAELPVDKGSIVDLIEVSGALYALFEYGIVRLSFSGAARDFAVEELSYGGGRIFGGSAVTVGVGGERAYFLAESGLYSFDGNTVKEIACRADILPLAGNGQVCSGAVCDGLYYLAYTDEDGVRRGLAVDGQTGEWCSCAAFEGVNSWNGRTFAVTDGVVCELSRGTGEGVFTVPSCDFGDGRKKTLQSLTLKGEGQVTVRVKSGFRTRTADFTLTSGVATAKIGLLGKAFTMELLLSRGASIKELSVRYAVLQSAGVSQPFFKRRKNGGDGK